MTRLAGCFLASALLTFAAAKDRNWTTGKVIDSVTSLNQAVDTHVITIQGDGATYVVQEKPAWHNECLVVIGDTIKYAEDKKNLILMDAGGTHCLFAIVGQAKRP